MGWRRQLLRLMLPAGFLPLLLTPAWGQLQGNQYSSPIHRVAFARPDDTWRFLEAPSEGNVADPGYGAVAAFSNGDGQAIALLVHHSLASSETITSEKNMDKRWSLLTNEIIAIVGTGESSPMVEKSTHGVAGGAATFEITFRSVSPGGGEILKNWVTGMIVCDPSDQQHIYAVRCAVPEPAFNAWQADFSQIMGTLRYEGERRVTVFPPPQTRLWWWLAPLLGLGVLVLVMRRRARARVNDYNRRMESDSTPKTSEADHRPDQVYATGGFSAPPAFETSSALFPNIPDQMGIPNALGRSSDPGSTDYVPTQPGYATPDQAAAVHSEVPANFWKCACGRINPNSHEFCARCNADRVKKTPLAADPGHGTGKK